MIGMRVTESWVTGVEVGKETVKAKPTGKWRLTQTNGGELIIWCEMTYVTTGLVKDRQVTKYFQEREIVIRKVIDFD